MHMQAEPGNGTRGPNRRDDDPPVGTESRVIRRHPKVMSGWKDAIRYNIERKVRGLLNQDGLYSVLLIETQLHRAAIFLLAPTRRPAWPHHLVGWG
jgi:hypothetical protein